MSPHDNPPTATVLFVCLGNICRSPLAEAALRQVAKREGIDIHVDSAGTGDWHIGLTPDLRAQAVAKRLGGLDISALRARQVSREDFYRFDHILAMDRSNLSNLQAMTPVSATAKLTLFLDHVPGQKGQSVADPYYGDVAEFEACWHQVNAAARCFIKVLAAESGFA